MMGLMQKEARSRVETNWRTLEGLMRTQTPTYAGVCKGPLDPSGSAVKQQKICLSTQFGQTSIELNLGVSV
jgi:hypothetical protein